MIPDDSPGDFESVLKPLWLRAQSGDDVAYRQALRLLASRLRAYLKRRLTGLPDEVEDPVQETLLALHLQRGTYDSTLPVSAWAMAIARHKLVDLWRRRGRRDDDAIDAAIGNWVRGGRARGVDRRLWLCVVLPRSVAGIRGHLVHARDRLHRGRRRVPRILDPALVSARAACVAVRTATPDGASGVPSITLAALRSAAPAALGGSTRRSVRARNASTEKVDKA